jgi:hypothetical protein
LLGFLCGLSGVWFGVDVLELAHAVAFEFDPVGVVDDAIEDGVGESWLTEHARVPLFLSGSCLTSRSLTRIIFYLGAGLRC